VITIGQLARYAGVTVKTVRHYHRLGLLDEPSRDSSGYRRYTAADALEWLKIRTLARAGVPLVRIKDLLNADPDQFTAAVADIDRRLQERADAIRDTHVQGRFDAGGQRRWTRRR
jgi:DNA-binding transcriptional MerR regulator